MLALNQQQKGLIICKDNNQISLCEMGPSSCHSINCDMWNVTWYLYSFLFLSVSITVFLASFPLNQFQNDNFGNAPKCIQLTTMLSIHQRHSIHQKAFYLPKGILFTKRHSIHRKAFYSPRGILFTKRHSFTKKHSIHVSNLVKQSLYFISPLSSRWQTLLQLLYIYNFLTYITIKIAGP